MEIYYQNSTGEKVYFDRTPYKMLSETSLFDYEWEYQTQGYNFQRIVNFGKSMVTSSFDLVINGSTKEEYKQNLKNLLNIIEKDILHLTPGKLFIGNTYIRCYIYKNSKSGRYVNTKKSVVTLEIISETGSWIEESTTVIGKMTNGVYNQDFLDYPHEYPYDYTNSLTSQMVINEGYADSDFEMRIYGFCINPAVSIGNHTYRVYTQLDTGEHLIINSVDKVVRKVKNNGEVINQFYLRDRDFYIFEKIPAGRNPVVWSGEYGFDITLLMERSEPRWT